MTSSRKSMSGGAARRSLLGRLGRCAASPARVIRAAAGLPGAIRRRGSVLVIVLGTLAMMSVLAVVFVTVGQSDRRASAAAQRQAKMDDVPEQVRDYVASVIARDVLATFPSLEAGKIDPRNPNSDTVIRYVLRRETWDYPSCDPSMLSVPEMRAQDGRRLDPLEPDLWRFRPEGDHPRLSYLESDDQYGNPMDWDIPRRKASDPWLSPEAPSNLVPDDDIVTEGFDLGGPGIPGDTTPDWFNRRDWANLSNFAPDGRAVNLFNLWPAGTYSFPTYGFDAPSGVGPGTISDKLTLMDEDLKPYPIGGTQRTIDGAEADPNVPAHWFSRQRGIAVSPTTGQSGIDWGSPLYLPYQFADADGDGILDSRWQELVDATMPGSLRNLLVSDGDTRYFFAFRAVDLGARLNVNVASDFTQAPTAEFPAGWTPADIDLRRLLGLEDTRQEFRTQAGPTDPYPYLELPRDLQGKVDDKSPQLYEAYDSAGNFGISGNRVEIGGSAYDSLIASSLIGAGLPRHVTRSLLKEYLDSEYQVAFPGGAPQTWVLTPRQRFERFQRAASASGGIAIDPDLSNGDWRYRPANFFGDADLLELLTYNGCNDSSVRSTLESVLGGRHEDELNLDPLRSNRLTSLERGDRDRFDAFPPVGSPKTQRDNDNDWNDTDADAYVQLATDIRMRLTTVSGARPIMSTALDDWKLSPTNPNTRGPSDRLDESKKAIADVVGDPYELFRLYRDALAPFYAVEEVWDPSSNPELRTLSYGYNGPELAIRMAAHMAANMADAVESDGIPTALAITLNNTGDTALNSAITAYTDQTVYPWMIQGGDDLIAETSQDNLQFSPVPQSGSNAFIAYGIEPQPVITEVASYFVFADAPYIGAPDPNKDGDREWDVMPPGEPLASIRDGVTAQNPDFIFECIAVQISNPFQQAINLGDPASPYYLEFGGKFYSLSGMLLTDAGGKLEYPPADAGGKRLPQVITIPPGESKTFYMFSQRLEDVQRKMDHADLHARVIGGPNRIDIIGEFIRNNLAPDGDIANAVLIEEIPSLEAFPTPLASQASMDGVQFFRDFFPPRNQPPQPITEVSLWRAHKVGGDDFPADANRDNDPQNDQLVDRMRFPLDPDTGETFSLDRRIDLDNTLVLGIKGHAIEGATAKGQTLDDNSNYNQGLTVFTYARVRRPNDGSVGADSVAMPMWAVEGRQDDWNIADKDSLGTRLDSMTASDFSPTGTDSFFFRFSWRDSTRPNFLDSVVLGTSNVVRDKISLHEDAADKDNDSRDTADPHGNNLSGQTRNNVRIELHLGLDRRTMRVGDLLLPLAIGPEYHPETGEWITLSEALSMAMDYWRFNDSASTPAGLLPYETDPGAPGLAQQLPLDAQVPPAQVLGLPINHGPLDRGHLVIDGFVPFIDADPTDPPRRFDPRTEDMRVGLGLTPAMSILENVRSLDSQVIAVWNFNDGNFQADRWITRDENPSTNDEPRLQVTQGAIRQPSTWPVGETLGADLGDPAGVQVQFAASTTDETQVELQIPSRGWRNLYLSYAANTIPVGGTETVVYHQWQYFDGSAWQSLGGATPVHSGAGDAYMRVDLSAASVLDNRPGNSPARIRLTMMDANGARDGVGGAFKGVAECTIDNLVVSAAPVIDSTLVTATPGVINLNTAGRLALSTLPMVSPTIDQWPSYAPTAGTNVWWWPAGTSGHPHDYRVDIAAALGAYREKTYAVPRKRSINDLGDWRFSFDDRNGWGALFGGRAAKNYISGIREDYGFASQAELLGVALRDTPTGIPGGFNNALRYSIDRLGRDLGISGGQAQLDHAGLTSERYTTTNNGDDGIANDYDEKLAIANALFNTTSVRSDYFAVWFVMHGYKRSDVEGLPAGSPLVPSVARRFVMVVDRSNVTKPGDTPRVLFFKEVPM